jgi:arylsulfatase A-like enzyme
MVRSPSIVRALLVSTSGSDEQRAASSRSSTRAAAILILMCAACTGMVGEAAGVDARAKPVDGSVGTDASTDAETGPDSGPRDSGPGASDAAPDEGRDAGTDAGIDAGTPDAGAPSRPNIVLIVSDDQGWNDVSLHGSEIPTPNLDRIANEGAELRRFYVQPVCTPTRVGLMTGRYPIQFGLMRGVIRPWNEVGLPLAATTVAEMLGAEGTAVRGAIGKWHLGHARESLHHPLAHGFTSFYGAYLGSVDYFSQERFGERDWHRGTSESGDTGYVTDLIGDEAVAFVGRHAHERFFLYVPFTAPHIPLQAPPALISEFAHISSPSRRTYAAMMTSLDRNVGRIIDELSAQGILDQTLIWFLSDNGGDSVGDNSPLRGGKHTVYDGGIRAFSAVRYPPAIPTGTVVREPIAYIDVLPTLAHLAGVSPPVGVDGVDMWDHVTGRSTMRVGRTLVFYNQYRDQEERTAALRWPHKLVRIRDLSTSAVSRRLYDLSTDPGERAPLTDPVVEMELNRAIDDLLARSPGSRIDPSERPPPGFTAPTDWRMR